MENCHHEEALDCKFKHKRANKSLSDADQWLSRSNTQASATRLQSRRFVASQPRKVLICSLTLEVDIESINRAYIASIGLSTSCHKIQYLGKFCQKSRFLEHNCFGYG